MGFHEISPIFNIAIGILLMIFLSWRILFTCWILPIRTYRKLRRNGFEGPSPSFPLGNINDMRMKNTTGSSFSGSSNVNHDIHSTALPYFSRWQKAHGKVFIYWLGTEPFLYIADAEFLRKMSAQVTAKSWGKPTVFKIDRDPMFGNALVMAEGNDWVRQRHVATPALSPMTLKAMVSLMVESTCQMLDRWSNLTNNSSHSVEIDIEREIIIQTGQIIAKIIFGMELHQRAKQVFEQLRALQRTLFKTQRLVGVPFSKFLYLKKTLEAKRLGRDIDKILVSIISTRRKSMKTHPSDRDLLGLLLLQENNDNVKTDQIGKKLTTREIVDQCKTFFFGGHETMGLAITWTFLLLAMYPEWQNILREEIKEVFEDQNENIDFTGISKLKKMEWVMNEVLRLYPSAPNAQRQAREDIQMEDQTIPKGTNMWIDIVAMHHDQALWGDDVNKFRPERFKDDTLYGGCSNKMGFLPFGFGGRMCIGRNLSILEYKIVVTLILSRFSFTFSPNYCHSPSVMLSLRPAHGLPIILHPL